MIIGTIASSALARKWVEGRDRGKLGHFDGCLYRGTKIYDRKLARSLWPRAGRLGRGVRQSAFAGRQVQPLFAVIVRRSMPRRVQDRHQRLLRT